VIYLRTSVTQQLARTRRGDQRPLLRNPDPGGILEQLMRQRAPLYEAAADLTVDTDGRRVAAVVEEIAARLASAKGT
jgi:shikimate kinase